MSEESDPFVRFIKSQRDNLINNLAEGSLVVTVFGPGVESDNLGSRKRKQIVDTLCRDGHKAFTPEQFLNVHDFDMSWLEQEIKLLYEDFVDFVIVLLTEDSQGANMEIARISGHPEIMCKTGILYPLQQFSPKIYFTANTVGAFPNLHLYTEDEMDTCQVVAKCRDWIAGEKHDVDRQDTSSQSF